MNSPDTSKAHELYIGALDLSDCLFKEWASDYYCVIPVLELNSLLELCRGLRLSDPFLVIEFPCFINRVCFQARVFRSQPLVGATLTFTLIQRDTYGDARHNQLHLSKSKESFVCFREMSRVKL